MGNKAKPCSTPMFQWYWIFPLAIQSEKKKEIYESNPALSSIRGISQ